MARTDKVKEYLKMHKMDLRAAADQGLGEYDLLQPHCLYKEKMYKKRTSRKVCE